MNCFAGCLQMAGTVMTHRMSSLTILVEDWSESSWRQWFLKNLSAWANTFSASIFLPLAAWISTPLWRSWGGEGRGGEGRGGGGEGRGGEGRGGEGKERRGGSEHISLIRRSLFSQLQPCVLTDPDMQPVNR